MTRSITAGMQTHLAGNVTSLAICWRIKRKDNVEFFFTDHDKDIDYNGDTYQTLNSGTMTALQHTGGARVDNTQIEMILDSDDISEVELKAGYYRNAEIWVFMINYEDPADDIIRLMYGRLGDLEIEDNTFKVQMRSLAQQAQNAINDYYGPDCSVDLGDSRCRIRLDPPTWLADTDYTVRPANEGHLGSVVKPTVANDLHYVCTTAGRSGLTEPTWNTTPGGITTDGTVEWTGIVALTVTGSVTTVIDRESFIDSSKQGTPVYGQISTAGATFDASDTFGPGYEPDKAFDANITTRWSGTGDSLPEWLECDFGSGETENVRRLRMYPFEHPVGPHVSVKDFTLQYSDNGSDWSDAESFQCPDNGEQWYSFDVSLNYGAHRYWRVYVTTSWRTDGGESCSIFELEFYEITGSTGLFQDNYFTYGKLVWTSGQNINLEFEIRDFEALSGEFKLQIPVFNPIGIGDTFTLTAGCDRLKDTCKNKFDNFNNYRGFPDIPGMDNIMNWGNRGGTVT